MSARVDFTGRRVAVTGGAGLIGSYLVEHLAAAGARVTVVDDFSKGRRENLAAVSDRIEVREGDLEDARFAFEAVEGAEVVFHLASRAFGVGYGNGRHVEILNHNERITTNLIDALARLRPAHVLMTSSSCVYDDDGPETMPELPLFDREPEKVNWGYGWAKRFLEQKSVILSRETGIPVTIVRPFNIYGERYLWVGEYSQAIPMLIKRVMDGEDPVVMWGSGRQRRNYMHASDCARLMMRLVAAGHSSAPVNLGTEETITVHELVELICRRGGKTPILKTDTTKPEGRFCKSASSERLRAILGDLDLKVTLDDGIGRMIDWYRATFPSPENHH